jgi:hypothetical protein
MTTDLQLEAVLCKQAAGGATAGRYLLGQLLSGPAKALRGTGRMLSDVGHSGGVIEGVGNKLRQWAVPLNRTVRDSKTYAKNMSKAVGEHPWYAPPVNKGSWWKQKGMQGLGQVAQWAPLSIPAVGAAYMPIWSTMQNAGNMAGQAFATAGGRGKQLATDGAMTAGSQMYDLLQSLPYNQRRQFLNNPDVMKGLVANNAPGAGALVQGAARPEAGIGTFLKQLSPFGQGDLTPWMQRQTYDTMRQQMGNMVKGGSIGSAAGKGMFRSLMSRMGDRTLRSANKWIKWPSRVGLGLAAAAPVPLALGGVMGYLGGGQKARQMGVDASMAGMQQQLAQMPAWQRELVAADPSLLMVGANRKMPGLTAKYEQMSGQQFKPGMLANIYGGMNNNQWGYRTQGGFKNV